MSVKIIHLSDLHLRENEESDENVNFGIIKNEIRKKCESEEQKPIIIITGDIVDDGAKQEQFEEANKQLKDLYDQYIVWPIPGNHEYGTGGYVNKGGFRRFKVEIVDNNVGSLQGDTKYPQMRQFYDHYFFGLNSITGVRLFKNGDVYGDQLEKLKAGLDSIKNKRQKSKRIVFLHNHPFSFDRIRKRINGITLIEIPALDRWRTFMETIQGSVDVLLFGHQHYFADFSNLSISRKYNIPYILSCGKSTNGDKGSMKGSTEYLIDNNNRVNFNNTGTEHMYGWGITIDENVQVEPLIYSNQ